MLPTDLSAPEDDAVDLRAYLAVLARRWKVVVAVVLVVVLASLALSFSQSEKYRAESILIIRQRSTESLVADLGDAYTEELERTAIGHFRLEDADTERLVPLEDALSFMPAIDLDADQARRVGHGQKLAGSGSGSRRLMHQGRLVAIAEAQDEMLKPTVVIPA